MQEADIVNTILDYILTIDFTKTDSVCSLFETTIRYLAGMLSGYDLLTGPFSTLTTNKTAQITSLLTQSVTLADTLKFAFNTATGIPHNNLNINSQSFADSNSNGLATIGTLVLEWTRLSDLTNDPTYANLSQAAESYLLSPQPPWAEPFPGLVGTGVDIDTGLFTDATGGWVGGDDSFYEYLIKMFVYDPLRFSQYRDRWVAAADSSIKYLASHPVSQPNITYLAAFQNQSVIETSQHLACFDGGNFILGGLVLGSDEYTQFGLNLTDGCRNTYQSTASQIGPEVFSWDASTIPSDQAQFFQDHGYYITDSIYDLRPEYLESLYYAYRVTGDTKYQDWSWDAFVAINASTRTGSGFSEIGDVGQVGGGAKGDNQESFLFAEVLKYAYVIHSEDGPFQVNYQGGEQFVFNTEAHPFKVSSPSTHTAQQRGWRGKRSEEEEAGCSC
ncbi:maturation of Asn-linked oligosaccharides protein [Thelotrema lepadinum]|nr:maturation of Asn-linked oligosaccharides protein [Thelotrema lepadinum]